LKVKLTLHKPYGDLEVEADNFEELVNGLGELYKWSNTIDEVIATGSKMEEKDMLKGVVEHTKEGPTIIAPKEKLTSKEAIGILLYAKGSEGLKPQQVGHLLSLSGFLSLGYGSRLSELRREGLVYKDGELYRLTAQGKRWVEGIFVAFQAG